MICSCGIYLLEMWLIILGWIDIRKKSVTVLHLGVGAALSSILMVWELMHGEFSGIDMIIGMIPGIIIILVAFATGKAGYADGIILLILSISVNRNAVIFCFLSSLLAIAIVSGVLLALRKVKRNTCIPYIPFMAFGLALAIIGGMN